MATPGNDGDSCGCYFDAANISPMSQQGDRKACFMSCMAQFLQSVSPGSERNPEGMASTAMCETLNGTATGDGGRFWPLYWCDMNYCGLGVDVDSGRKGQDPNVNKIINNCNGIGVSTILDSGPPSKEFSCSSDKDGDSTCNGPMVMVAPSSAQEVPGPEPSPTKENPTHPTAAHPTVSSKAATDTHGSSSSAGTATTTTESSGLTHGAKIALAVCSVLGLVVLVGLIFVCLRRRKRRQFRSALLQSQLLGSTGGRGGDGMFFPFSGRGGGGDGGYSATPLISPAGSAVGGSITTVADPPLTPPLRLRDRRLLLPSILLRPGTSRSSDVSPPLTPLTPAYSPNHTNANNSSAGFFPTSPICAPTVNKLIPRHERTPTPQKIPIDSLPPLPSQIACALPSTTNGANGGSGRGSVNSCANTMTTTATAANSHTSLLRHEVTLSSMTPSASTGIPPPTCSSPPGSPPRPPRPHDTPLEIPDLLSAAPAPSSMSPPPTLRGFSPPPLPSPLPSPPPPPLAVSVSVHAPTSPSPLRTGFQPASPSASTFQGFSGPGSYFLRQAQRPGSPRSFSSPFGGGGGVHDTPRSVGERKASSPTPATRTLELNLIDRATTNHANSNVADNGNNDARGSWGSWDGTPVATPTMAAQGRSTFANNVGGLRSATPTTIPTPVPVSPLSMAFSAPRSPFQSGPGSPRLVSGPGLSPGVDVIGSPARQHEPANGGGAALPFSQGEHDDDDSSGSEYDYHGHECGYGSGNGSAGVGSGQQAQGNAHDRHADPRNFIGGAF